MPAGLPQGRKTGAPELETGTARWTVLAKAEFVDILNYIKSKGLIPGLWLEIDACQYQSQAYGFDDSFFLMRHGSRVGGRRAFFDYRNPAVREYMNKKIDSLVTLGAGYFKNDYNQSTGWEPAVTVCHPPMD